MGALLTPSSARMVARYRWQVKVKSIQMASVMMRFDGIISGVQLEVVATLSELTCKNEVEDRKALMLKTQAIAVESGVLEHSKYVITPWRQKIRK
jgi:hypothetical protein